MNAKVNMRSDSPLRRDDGSPGVPMSCLVWTLPINTLASEVATERIGGSSTR